MSSSKPRGLEEAPTITAKLTTQERQTRRLSLPEKLRLVNLGLHYGPSQAARSMQVTRDTAYYWLRRFEEGGSDGLGARPRGKSEPRTVTPEVRQRLLDLKTENPARSAAKVGRVYEEESGLRIHRTTVWAALKKGARQSSP